MSSSSSPSSLTVSSPSRRKSSLPPARDLIDNHIYGFGDVAPSSSPPLSSSPLHLARSHECTKWQASDYLDDPDGEVHNQRDKADDVSHPWSRHTGPARSIPYIHRPLPSLMTKFATHTFCGGVSLPFTSSPFSVPQTTHFYPQGDSAIADDCEEYDLESMDIHIHETYFATSAERGRWLSSPIASRIRSQPAPPMRGHSSPIKTPADTSPLGDRSRRRTKSCTVDKQISSSPSEDHDGDMRYSSPLPPSSPLTSPLSSISFPGDDFEGDPADDPCSNSDDYNYFRKTPDLSTSSTTCTSPVQSARPPTPREPLAIVSAHPPTDSLVSAMSCHSSPRQSHLRNPVDARLHASDALSFESDGILSPLSQFELDLPEAEHLKLPLSDMENKLHAGQRTASPSVTVDAVRSHNEPSSVQFLPMNPDQKPPDVSPGTGGANSHKNVKRRRENASRNPGAKGAKKRAAIRSESPSSDVKKRRGVENRTSTHSEPPVKQSRLSRCADDSRKNSRPRCGGIPRVERLWRSPSRPADKDCESDSVCAHDRKTSTSAAQLQQSALAPVDAVDTEFHASLTGMLIEAFAASRATSMDSAALYLVLTQAHPYLATERPKQGLLMDIAGVLEAGRARCGMFEKVDSSGERSRHKALENRWFYIPERDEDKERASLISAIMPRQKRSETKKYKQYYYRPLDKISRWDPEDAA